MKKRFKKIYVEITNKCNLSCTFCSTLKRKTKEMTPEEFRTIIEKIKPYTDYIYLHVKGEPLLHTKLDALLSICDENNIKVNITTNGTFIKNRINVLSNHSCIRQINVSLHCENDYSNYFEDVFYTCHQLSQKMYISYRIWNLNNLTLDKKSTDIVNKIINYYKLDTTTVEKIYKEKEIKIFNNTFVNKENLFMWPDESNGFDLDGKCYGLDTHIGILADGTVVPCCLDGNGDINLGNIFIEDLDEILNSSLVKNMLINFKNGKSICKLCKNCNFRKRFIK